MNRIKQLFQRKDSSILNIYFTAGYPNLEDTLPVMQALEKGGADLIEIGMPFSDPIADGPTIQESNMVALKNGMTIQKLFEQLKGMREKVNLPVVLMGYLNPIMQFGVERFCKEAETCGVDGLILPDLPMDEYLQEYKALFDAHGLYNIFLITPQTSDHRIKTIDDNSEGFIYMVSSASITGAKKEITPKQIAYFNRVKEMNLTNPRLIGFGISDRQTFSAACQYAQGAIIGSAFINKLKEAKNLEEDIIAFVKSIKSDL